MFFIYFIKYFKTKLIDYFRKVEFFKLPNIINYFFVIINYLQKHVKIIYDQHNQLFFNIIDVGNCFG